MASNQTVARISLVADVANANAQLKKVSAQVDKLEKELAEAGKAAQKTSAEFKKMAEKDAAKAEKQIAKLEGQIKGLTQRQEDAQKSTKRANTATAQMAANLTIAYDGFRQLTDGVKAYGQEAARIEGLMRNQKFALDDARASTQGMISDIELVRLGNSASSLELAKNSKEFADFAKAAQLAGRKLGLGPVEAIESMNAALGRGSSEMLDNAGIVLRQSDAARIYANQLGKTVSALTEAEKKEAFRVVGMQKLVEASRGVNDELSTGTKLSVQFSTAMQNLEDNVHNLPALFGDLATEIQHAYQAWVGFDDEVQKAGDEGAWFSFRDTAVKSMAPILAITDGIRVNLERINALRNGSGMGGLASGIGQKAAFKQRASSLSRPENAMALVQGLGAVGLDAVNIAQGAGMAFADSLADPAEKKRGGGGGRGQRRTIATQGAGPAAIDLHDGRMGQNAALAEAEAMQLERALEIQQAKLSIAEQSATDEETRHQLRMMQLEQQAIAEEKIYAARIQAAEYAGDQAQVVELRHESEMMRLESKAAREQEVAAARARHAAQEQAELERSRQLYMSWGQTTGSVLSGFSQTYQMAAEQAGVGDRKRQQVAMRMGGVVLLTEAAVAAGKAAVAYASGNIPQGVALTAAAAFATARGSMLLAGNVPGADAGGGGGGQGGVMGTTFAGGGGGGGRSANAPGSRVPGSPTAADGRPKPSGRSGGAGGNTVILNYSPGVQVGKADQETAEELASLVARGGMGSFNA